MTEFRRRIEEEIPRLRRYARALTRNGSRCDDLVQDTLVRALAKEHLWQPGTNMRAWLFTIMHNQNVNAVQSAMREGMTVDIEEQSPTLVATTDPTVARQLHELDRALAQVPEEQRQVILLVGLEGMSYEDAAAVLQIPVGTVRSRLSRGRDALRMLMGMRGRTVKSGLDSPSNPATMIMPAEITTSDVHTSLVVPALIADIGDDASWRYVEFFTANIRNPHTRRAYVRACSRFFVWCDQRGLTLAAIRPFDIATYIESLQKEHSAPGVKQQLAAVRMLFDWLITGQMLPTNPAVAVRGPKHVVRTGKTPVLEGTEWRKLLKSVPDTTSRDLRDRALIATLTYSFARINAALKMKVEDLRPHGAGWTIWLHEKGGKQHSMPCHHALAEALRAYIDAAGIVEDRKGWLFRTARGHNGSALSDKPMSQPDAWRMIRRRASAVGIAEAIGCHTFRATGITAYLANGGALRHAQEMAAHESPRTTKLYDRTKERLTQDEVERIRFVTTR